MCIRDILNNACAAWVVGDCGVIVKSAVFDSQPRMNIQREPQRKLRQWLGE